MSYDSIIFDLDGTLWDCAAASAAAANASYAEVGIAKRVDVDFIRSIAGKPVTECDEILLEDVPDAIQAQVARAFEVRELSEIEKTAESALLPGVRAGILSLYHKFPLFVVSNCSVPYLAAFQNYTSVGKLFTDCECYGRTYRPKGENIRDVILRNALKTPCYVGDTNGDEQAANLAQVPFFHAAYGFGTLNRPVQAFQSFTELTDFFLKK